MSRFICLFLLSFLLASCKKDEPVPEVFNGFQIPAGFPAPKYNFATNPITEDGFKLGRKLFYDPILSSDTSTSCGNCHLQSGAFSHPEHPVSHGIKGRLGTRNAPAVQNMAWQTDFFWDGGVHDLDLFPFAPIENPKEMDDKVGNVLTKLKQSKTYPALFEKAFGSQEINSARMMQAMSQFMCMLVSANSRYDQYVAGNSSVFSNTETQGLQIFRQKCTGCHAEPLFTDNSFRNNGLDSTSDIGRQRISLDPGDRFKFKVPSLRNVVRTFPYMHKGTKNDLESVLIHYQSGIRQSPTLDPLLKNGFTISDDEKNKLIAFLKTLSDEKFIRNPLFSEQ